MNFFSFVPLPAVLVLLLLLVIIVVSAILLSKRKKPAGPPETGEQVLQPLPTTPQQANPLSQSTPATQTMNISTQLVKSDDPKYLILIVIAALLTVFIPLLAVIFVKNQQPSPTQQVNLPIVSACNAITITDTLNNPLSDESLANLRPGDEVKILISATGNNLTKARFRVNGSEWQEITIKEENNFIGNYILDADNKFAIEAEVFDASKGWL